MITSFTLSAKIYQSLKWFTLIFLPAFSAAYFTLSSIWGLPAPEQVMGTCAVISTFLGALLGVSSKNYSGDGQIVVERDTEDGHIIYGIELADDAAGIADKNQFVLNVVNKEDG